MSQQQQAAGDAPGLGGKVTELAELPSWASNNPDINAAQETQDFRLQAAVVKASGAADPEDDVTQDILRAQVAAGDAPGLGGKVTELAELRAQVAAGEKLSGEQRKQLKKLEGAEERRHEYEAAGIAEADHVADVAAVRVERQEKRQQKETQAKERVAARPPTYQDVLARWPADAALRERLQSHAVNAALSDTLYRDSEHWAKYDARFPCPAAPALGEEAQDAGAVRRHDWRNSCNSDGDGDGQVCAACGLYSMAGGYYGEPYATVPTSAA